MPIDRETTLDKMWRHSLQQTLTDCAMTHMTNQDNQGLRITLG